MTALPLTAAGTVSAIVTVPPGGAGLGWVTDAFRVLKPGGHLVTFGGDSWHRLAVAVEDAGFEVRDSIAALTAAGFEPVLLARKPLVGTVAANVLAHGTGALNIDGCRVGTDDNLGRPEAKAGFAEWSVANGGQKTHHMIGRNQPATSGNPAGRWPANVVLDPVTAAALDEQSGTLKSGDLKPYRNSSAAEYRQFHSGQRDVKRAGDSGGASRFFPVHSTRADLLAWLTRLVAPAGGTVLDPFAAANAA